MTGTKKATGGTPASLSAATNSRKKPTKAEQRAALWASLNDRQQTYLLIIYEADQEAEGWARGAWARGERAGKAEVWRWLDYGITTSLMPGANGDGLLQRRLTAAGVRDQGAGSTLAVLRGHGLIKERGHLTLFKSVMVQIQMTPEGRAVARAGGADGARTARSRKPDQLAEGHWSMMAEVAAAGAEGLSPRSFSGAWDRLVERGLVEHAGFRYRFTDAGRDHYELGWRAYALLYPTINAVLPDGSRFWPREVDRRLAALDQACRLLATAVQRATTDAAATLPSSGPIADENPLSSTPEIARAAELHQERVEAVDRLRSLAAGQVPELTELHGRAACRFLAVATAVLTAVASGADPVCAAKEIPEVDHDEPMTELPAPPVGLPVVDKSLADERSRLLGRPKRGRARAVPAPVRPDVMATYARKMTSWTAKGYLARLMLRQQDPDTESGE